MSGELLQQLIGEWGPYQTRLLALMAPPLIPIGFGLLQAVIMFHIPAHRCQVPGLQNDSFLIQNEQHRQLVNLTVPKDDATDHGYTQCTVFTHWNASQDVASNTRQSHATDRSKEVTVACGSWVYDLTEFDSTFITQFDLVCERKQFRTHLNVAYLAGNMAGSAFSGLLGDWIGRKTVFYIANVLNLVVGVASAFPPSPEVFLLFRFLMGVVGDAIYVSASVLVLEFVGPEWRTTAGSLVGIMWLTGAFLVAGLSFFVRHWQHIQLIGTVPLVLCLGYWWILPESPRWLLMMKKTKAAMKVIEKAAEVNRLPLPPSAESVLEKAAETREESVAVSDIVRQLFHPRFLLVRTLIIFYNGIAISMTYYGLSLNVGNLGGSVRVNFLVSCVMELAGYLLAWFLLERLGRKRSNCCFMLVAGLACLATIFTVAFGGTDLQLATTGFAMVGKLGISAAYASFYIFSAELFPTVMRTFGLGCSSTFASLGGVVSPYVADLSLFVEGRFSRAVPLVVFGGWGVLAGLSSLFLPETLHSTLPDTMEDAVSVEQVKEDTKVQKRRKTRPN